MIGAAERLRQYRRRRRIAGLLARVVPAERLTLDEFERVCLHLGLDSDKALSDPAELAKAAQARADAAADATGARRDRAGSRHPAGTRVDRGRRGDSRSRRSVFRLRLGEEIRQASPQITELRRKGKLPAPSAGGAAQPIRRALSSLPATEYDAALYVWPLARLLVWLEARAIQHRVDEVKALIKRNMPKR